MLVFVNPDSTHGMWAAPRPCEIIEVQYTAYGTRYKVRWGHGMGESGYLHSRHFKVASYF